MCAPGSSHINILFKSSMPEQFLNSGAHDFQTSKHSRSGWFTMMGRGKQNTQDEKHWKSLITDTDTPLTSRQVITWQTSKQSFNEQATHNPANKLSDHAAHKQGKRSAVMF
eukprot:1161542-Pelagomonas_calceolata.AAC.6